MNIFLGSQTVYVCNRFDACTLRMRVAHCIRGWPHAGPLVSIQVTPNIPIESYRSTFIALSRTLSETEKELFESIASQLRSRGIGDVLQSIGARERACDRGCQMIQSDPPAFALGSQSTELTRRPAECPAARRAAFWWLAGVSEE